MNILVKSGIIAALAAAGVGRAHADVVTTNGGIKVVSSNGDFSAAVGTLVQFDAYADENDSSSKIGSGVANGSSNDAFRFRRVWITLAGKVYSFHYHVDYDTVTGALARAWLEHDLLHGSLFIGQDKPWASLDEIARNPDTPFLERNIVSSSGVNAAATYSDGVFYEWSHRAFSANDNLWLGASAVSLHKPSGSADTSTQGSAYNARIAYAPIVAQGAWLHLGAAIIDSTAAVGSTTAGNNALTAAYAYGNFFDGNEKLTLASYPVASTSARSHSRSVSGELAGVYGPAYLQAEYDNVAFHQSGMPSNTVTAYSVTAAYALTGEARSYNAQDATYGTIAPAHSYGAWEISLRYDEARNEGDDGIYTGLALSGAKAALATADRVQLLTVGLNYYPNEHIRFVLNFEHGEANLGKAGTDRPNTIGARAQLWF